MTSRLIYLIVIIGLSQTVMAVNVGDTVPHFNANDHNGDLWQSQRAESAPRYRVVYFYPAAMTGGCTKQACAYRDNGNALKALNVEVVGVSADPVNNLRAFRKAENLNFALLSDVNGTIAEHFGVPLHKGGSIQRTVDGEEKTLTRPFTTARWTFVTDSEGKVLYKNDKVKAAQDTEAVMAFIKGL